MLISRFDNEYMAKEFNNLISSFGDNINFNDDYWVCNYLRKNPTELPGDYTIYFNRTPKMYREIVKYYCLSKKGAVATLNNELGNLNIFFNFVEKKYDYISLKYISKKIIWDFEVYVSELEIKPISKKSIFPILRKFFQYMIEYKDMPSYIPISCNNPFKLSKAKLRYSKKYIQEDVIYQLDELFKKQSIPLHYRLLYWILRSIPSRVSEVSGIKLDCIKPYGNHWVLIIPTWKKNGGHIKSQNRLIHINYEEHGKYLLDLVREQQRVSKALKSKLNSNNEEMLFTVERFQIDSYSYKQGNLRYIKYDCPPYLINKKVASSVLQNTVKYSAIQNNKGEAFNFTSHQLRHTGITNRLYYGFSEVEVRDMTGGNDDSVFNSSYYHSIPKKNKEIIDNIRNDSNTIKPLYFRGRIMNLDKDTEERLLRNPRAYEINDGELSLGICTDIFSCKSGIFECLICDKFAPKVEHVEYYQKQVDVWQEKCRLLKNNREQLQNAEFNLSCYRSILLRIEKCHEDNLTNYYMEEDKLGQKNK